MSDVDAPTALRLFVGKGGVGKTTLAAKAALDRARSGERVLVVSIDQAHSLADVFDADVTGNDVTPVVDGLDVLELNTLELMETRYRSLTAILALARAGHDHGLQFGTIEPEEIVGAPGIAELLGLHRIVELLDRREWDTVVVDMPASGDALRTLQMPDLSLGYLDRLWPQHDRIVAGTGADPRLTVVVALVERIVNGVEHVRDVLTDAATTALTVVATPERIALAEVRRTLSAAALLNLPVETVVVNKLLPQLGSSSVGLVGAHPAVFWFEGWRSEQQQLIAEFERVTDGLPLVKVERSQHEPVGLAALADLESWSAAVGSQTTVGSHGDSEGRQCRTRGADRPRVAHESGAGLESTYTMTMLLPVVDPTSLHVGRVEDDLVIGADGRRTRVRLASVLRRCIVVGADFEGHELVLRFRPDPSVWPV